MRDQNTKEPATEEMSRLFEITRRMGLVMSKSGAHRNVLGICPPLCIAETDVEFFERAIEESFRRL